MISVILLVAVPRLILSAGALLSYGVETAAMYCFGWSVCLSLFVCQ